MTFDRRNACPSLAVPMRTGDGFLARLPPLAEALTPSQLMAIAVAARTHGNGHVEISKRGNVQIRGLASADASGPSADLAEAGLMLSEGMPISSDPLASLYADAPDPAPVIAALHAALAESGMAARIAPKVALVLDLGGPTAPAGVAADLRLAYRADGVHLGLGGTHESALWIGTIAREDVVAAVLAVLSALSEHGTAARFAGSGALRDVSAILAAVPMLKPVGAPAAPASRPPVGPIDGLAQPAAGIAFPFGQAEAEALTELAETALEAGVTAFAPAPERALLFAGPATAVIATQAHAASLGFITEADDPRRFLSACIGSAGCASGHFPARALAAASAPALAPLLDGSIEIHFAGCGKGCAHPDPAAFTLSGIDKGAALVLDGRARDEAIGFASPEKLVEGLRRLGAARAERETARAAIARIGRAGIVSATIKEGSTGHGGEPGSSDGERLSA
ncbi:precorrin-3B synthase [Mesorhizobium sp. BR1-1-16]|uniref:precorrin-3B synthase n=1 Tax=Mesorhizobium sp. BR1-1-16 TaxID=2876653 RepID=UPI001CC96880|nr:precorrin-3B synthase [Mesorhizobium sp. BR1-1-16]